MKLAVPRARVFGRDAQGVPNEVGLFVPPEAVFPGTPATTEALIEVLGTLSRDDTLFHCARTNTIVSGHTGLDVKERQQILLKTLCTREEIARINAFTREHPGSGAPAVFFRGQVLELIRWVARYCRNLPGDGNTFNDRATRSRFVKSALIAGMLWSQRVYADRLSGGGSIEEIRRQSLGAFRMGMEEGNFAPHLGRTFGRGWSLFNDYFPRFYPDFHRDFLAATGLTLEQYMTCVTGLSTFTIATKKDGSLFMTQTVAVITACREILPIYLALEAQTPEQLAMVLWDGFEQRG